MTAERQNVTLEELLALVRRSTEFGIRVAMPGRVSSYDSAMQRADVTTEILAVVDDGSGERVQRPLKLPMVPVIWPRSLAGYLSLPLASGDTGLLVFCDRALEQWKRQGKPTDPKASRTHDLSDAVFFPGLHADANAISPPTDTTATVLEGPIVKVGRNASDFAALSSRVDLFISTLDALIRAWVPVAQDGGAALKAAYLASFSSPPLSVAASKAQVE